MYITRKVEFSASHLCRNNAWSDEKNESVYGNAANPHGHGHNYLVEVTLEGDPHPVTGMILDLKEVKDILEETIVEPMDHRFLNYEVPPFDRVVPTAENLALEIWRKLEPRFAGPALLHRVRLYETADLWVDIERQAAKHPDHGTGVSDLSRERS